MSELNFKIVTPERVVYENNILQVSIPTVQGEITVLPNHIPLIGVLQTGEMRVVDKNGEHMIAVAGGFVEIRGKNEVVVLADNAIIAREINIDQAEEARKRAVEQMAQIKNVEDVDFARLQGVIDREMNKIKVGRKYRKLPEVR